MAQVSRAPSAPPLPASAPLAPPPSLDIAALLQTPEAQAAIQAAAAKAAAAAIAEIKVASPALASVDDATKELFSRMALAIADISDQGTNRKRVAPEVLARRAEADRECRRLIERVRAENLEPRYRVIAKVWFAERLIEPYRRDPATKRALPQYIMWQGTPNEGLLPANDIATEIYKQYKLSIGSTDAQINTLDRRPVWITANGRVVRGDAPPKLTVEGLEDPTPTGGTMAGFEPTLLDNNDPNAPAVAVLGTIAAPIHIRGPEAALAR